jgi:hypothetical protein
MTCSFSHAAIMQSLVPHGSKSHTGNYQKTVEDLSRVPIDTLQSCGGDSPSAHLLHGRSSLLVVNHAKAYSPLAQLISQHSS